MMKHTINIKRRLFSILRIFDSVRVVFNEQDSTEQPLKYNGKELLREWGMDVYDYGARWMLPVAGPIFTQIDPLCEKYYDVSPYSYCKGNFMNAVDPDGRDDYYTRDGRYVGSDYRSTDNLRIMCIKDQMLKYVTDEKLFHYFSMPIEKIDLSARAFSNIFTDVLQRNGFDTSKLYNSKVSVTKMGLSKGGGIPYEPVSDYNVNYVTNWSLNEIKLAQTRIEDDKAITIKTFVYPKVSYERRLLSTVSNIINLLGVHEFCNHGVLGYSEEMHPKILENQKSHWSWDTTTKEFKEYYIKKYTRNRHKNNK